MPSNRSKFEQILDHWEPRLRDAFLKSISDIKSQVTLKRLIERLERGDIEGVLDLLNIDRSAFGPLELALVDTFNNGGIAFAGDLKLRDVDGNRIVFRFGIRDPEAEAWLRDHSALLVTRIVEDQRQAIRQSLVAGLSEGRNLRSTALDVVGRVSRATGRRAGGIVGLTSAQELFVASAREELLSGQEVALRNYLKRAKRDKRFDRTILAAIREGAAIPTALVDRIVGRYSDKLLQLRGEMIARTETLTALNAARNEGMRQSIASGKVDARYVTKRWIATPDDRTRDTHRVLHGQEVRFAEPFQSYSGAALRFPGDPTAPPHEHIGCRCTMELKVDYIGQMLDRRRAS